MTRAIAPLNRQLNHLGDESLLVASNFKDWEDRVYGRGARSETGTSVIEDEFFDFGMELPASPAAQNLLDEGTKSVICGPGDNYGLSLMQDLPSDNGRKDVPPSPSGSVPRRGDARRVSGGVMSGGAYTAVEGASSGKDDGLGRKGPGLGAEDIREFIEDTLARGPKGANEVHNVLRITATKPHLSMVVDKEVCLKPGSELFSFVVGPRERSWKPFYQETLQSNDRRERSGGTYFIAYVLQIAGLSSESVSRPMAGTADSRETDVADRSGAGPSLVTRSGLGLPVLIATSPHVKLLAQVDASLSSPYAVLYPKPPTATSRFRRLTSPCGWRPCCALRPPSSTTSQP